MTCNVCVGEPFSVPWSGTTQADAISLALIQEHFRDKHPEVELKTASLETRVWG